MFRLFLVFLLILLMAPNIFAQDYDEIIVTASRRAEFSPAIFVEKKGDFLLLDVTVVNDAREPEERRRDLKKTISMIIATSKQHPDITLSLVEDGFVRPLTLDAFMDSIYPGSQPDTSYADLKVKTDIPRGDVEAYKLVRKLDDFVESLEGVGRTTISTQENVAVSVINPFQYRDEVRQKVLNEMTSTLSELGPNYVIIPKGLDNNVTWTRSGDLNLKFYIEYQYKIYPKSLSVQISDEDDWE